MSDARDNGRGVLPSRSSWTARSAWRSGLTRRALAGFGVPAILAVAGLLPAQAGTQHQKPAGGVPSAVVCAGYAGCQARGDSSHGYADHASTSYWRMTAGNECTNYVAFVEATVFHAPEPGYLLGNAGQWPSSAAAHGVVVDNVPAVGAVAEWDGGAPGMGSMGHVAVVEQVGPHHRYIVISQQHIGSDPDGYDWTRINTGFPAAQWQERPSHFLHFAPSGPASSGTAAGYYNPRTNSFRLQAATGTGTVSFRRGPPGAIPLAGDWNGQGGDGTGFYDPSNAWFHLRNKLGPGPSAKAFRFGPPGMIPLAGNWDGHGGDSVGYYDPATGTFYLRDYLSTGPAEYTFRFGPPGMIPLAGDWTGAGHAGVGYYNPKTGWFYLREHLSAGRPRFAFRFGPRGMRPIAGNWTGGSKDGIGFYNPHSGWFHLRSRLSAGPALVQFKFGPGGMIPLVGKWAAA